MSELQYPTIEHINVMTGLKDKLVAKAFLETLMWLDQDAPEQFDGVPGKHSFNIQDFISRADVWDPKKEAYKDCGTVCCIAGAASIYLEHIGDNRVCTYGLTQFENMDPVLGKLFYPAGTKKPKTAARVLRHYLFTGKVDWKIKVGTIYDVQ